jgi:hypothetical protein
MRTEQSVMNDIASLPYRDIGGTRIEPGRLVISAKIENDVAIGKVNIVDGELCIDGIPIDDVLECTPLLIVGWVH